MSLMQLANDAGASVLTRSDNAAALAPTHPTNDAGASTASQSGRSKGELADAQSEREATAAQSGKLQGVMGGIKCHQT